MGVVHTIADDAMSGFWIEVVDNPDFRLISGQCYFQLDRSHVRF